VRQAAGGFSGKPLHVFTPGTAELIPKSGKAAAFEGANPERGVPLYYYLDDETEESLTIEILDSADEVVRRYSSEEGDFERCKISNMDPRLPFELKYPATEKGLNKWTWDMKHQGLNCIEHITLFAGFDGPGAAPGNYRARLSIGDSVQTVAFSVKMDRRISATDEEIQFWSGRLAEVGSLIDDALSSLDVARQAHRQIEELMTEHPEDQDLQQTGATALERITAWDGKIIQVLHQTYEDEDAWETMLAGQLRFLLDVIDTTGAPVTAGALLRLADLKAEWSERQAELQAIKTGYIDVINEWARRQNVPHVASPGR
ncbi:MAG: hypothetical protein ACE1Y4_01545, partial [Lysobacterales bacterium]